jgi:2-keto-myo-inositol isomerase
VLPFALNHMVAPRMRYDAFLRLAFNTGCTGVEFRNDLPLPLFHGDAPETVAAAAADLNISILSLAEVKAFNDWNDQKRQEAEALMAIARRCGSQAISLIPRVDGKGLGNGERQANLRVALRELIPLLAAHDLIGLVEPIGFEHCSLRHKSEAVDAIEALGGTGRIRLIHDTFHHHVAGGGPIYPDHTGIVHISGVSDSAPSTREMRDEHRVLIDSTDRLGNTRQLAELMDGGYRGHMSFEPFSPEVHAYSDPAEALARSFTFIETSLSGQAA